MDALRRLRDAGFTPRGILDVGAYRGDFARVARRIFHDAPILMIEALEEQSPVLDKLAREIGRASYAIALVGAEARADVPFYSADLTARPDLDATGSSRFRERSAFPMRERKLRQFTLASLVWNVGSFDLIKLDIQGAEIEALKGAGDLSQVAVVIMEMSLVQYNEGAPLIGEALSEMQRFGFALLDIVEMHADRLGRLLQIDGLFVRADSPLRPGPPFWS
jgi:FkbM family methyltransferase